ncbi:hydrocephalus-inducing protein homolog [Anabrus simplex]|uniref:hydrocephalus-inducing protein homolog n=1 Tax=Anabrus simplex TaxID=316456 RepID=UPI0034DD273A
MKMELGSGGSQIITLEGRSDVVKQISETFYCHAIVNAAHTTNKKQVLFSATFTANFIEPKVAFSKSQLNFRIDVGPDDELHLLQETVQVRNSSDLPHIIDFHIESPFMIMDENGELISNWSVPLEGLGEVSVTVVFDPSYRTDLYSRKARGYLWVRYHEHPHMDSITLIGEVNFPNIKFTPSVIDFGCIPVGSEACQDLKITNLSPLPVTFSWYWQEESVSIQHTGPVTVLPELVASEYQFNIEEEEDSQDKSASELEVDSPAVVQEEVSVADVAQELEEHIEDMLPEKKTSDIKTLEIKSSAEKLPENHSPEVSPENPQVELNKASVDKASEETPQNAEQLSQLKKKLFPLINCYFMDEAEIKCLEGLPTVSPVLPSVNKLFEITPFYGTLYPYESQILSVSFNGYSFLSGEAIALCQVEGGPSEAIKFKGSTSNICYHLNKMDIDFGWQVFCNICEEVITLSNFGLVGFDFHASTLFHPPDSPLEPGVVIVEPQSGHLEGQSEIQLMVRYLPGFSGWFQKTFQLEIGYLDPISLTVTGFGVFPQLYVCLPQPQSYVTPVNIGYKAVDNLTPYWFPQQKKLTLSNNILEPIYSRPIPASEMKELLSQNWVVITFQDYFPTRADIHLAVEREMAHRVVEDNPSIVLRHAAMTKCKPIVQFIAPPYDIDLGIVIVGTAVSFSAIMFNYGPVLVSSCLSCPQAHAQLKEAGIFIKVRDIKDLPIGQTAAMHIFFNPLYEQYPEKIKEIEFTFYLDIFHGPRIPIEVHGTVTVPFVTLSADCVNFGYVKYGSCKEMSLIIKNEGLVPCTWQASLQFKQKKKKNNIIKTITYDDKEPVFRFQCEKNSLSPNEEIYIELFFEPATHGVREMNFIITMTENPQRLCIPLFGIGMLPTINIIDSVLEFDTQLPHSQGQEIEFYIENPLNYPIEIFFNNYDTFVSFLIMFLHLTVVHVSGRSQIMV